MPLVFRVVPPFTLPRVTTLRRVVIASATDAGNLLCAKAQSTMPVLLLFPPSTSKTSARVRNFPFPL